MWHAALFNAQAFFRDGGLKPLHEVLGDPPPRKTLVEQKAEFRVFAEMWGLKVRPVNKEIKVVYPKGHKRHEAQSLH